MAMNNQIMIWVDDALAKTLALAKGFEPVRVWDNEAHTFTDEQDTTDAGLPVWESGALIPTGWGEKVTPICVRMAAQSAPKVASEPTPPHGGARPGDAP